MSSAQTITPTTLTVIEYDSEKYDSGDNFDTDTHRYTVPSTGYYLITISGWMDIPNSKYMSVEANKGEGDVNLLCQTGFSHGGTSAFIIGASGVVHMTEGEYIEFTVYHSNTGNLDLHERASSTHATVIRIA